MKQPQRVEIRLEVTFLTSILLLIVLFLLILQRVFNEYVHAYSMDKGMRYQDVIDRLHAG